ncbi:MAG: hypothetical protein ABFQ82_01050 [Thermodesulfobacteriota bacterium]
MRIPPNRIGFDIDGVVADTLEAFIRLAGSDYQIEVSPPEITDFMVEECLNIDLEIIEDIFSKLLLDPLGTGLEPMDQALAVLEELAREAPLTFITARPQALPINDWLEHHLSPDAFAVTRLVATGDHDNKADHIRRLGISHFIDDRSETCNQLALEKDITPIVYEQPWNMNKHRLTSVADWPSIKKLCLYN